MRKSRMGVQVVTWQSLLLPLHIMSKSLGRPLPGVLWIQQRRRDLGLQSWFEAERSGPFQKCKANFLFQLWNVIVDAVPRGTTLYGNMRRKFG